MKRVAVVLSSDGSGVAEAVLAALNEVGAEFSVLGSQEVRGEDFDAVVLLCATDTERVIEAFYRLEKPIGAFGGAAVAVARVLGARGVTVTAGQDDAAREISRLGAFHEVCAADDFVTDREHRVVTSPGSMHSEAARAEEMIRGVRGAIRELVEMA